MMIHPKVRHMILLNLSLILLSQMLFLPASLTLIFLFILVLLWWSWSKQLRVAKAWTFLLTLLALALIFFSYQSFLGIEAGVAVLSTFLFAKALETKNQRDLIVLFNFALFVSASSFLYSQAIWMAFAVLMSLISGLIGLYRIQSTDFEADEELMIRSFRQDANHVAKFIIYALPFFVLLFLFFPRLPPLWHIPIPENKAVTGISDRMSPGDIAQISQSSALAFRIIGDIHQLPARTELYWRALVLDEYDGQTWTSSFFNQQPLRFKAAEHAQLEQGWNYQYLATDASVLWIMGLEKSIPLEPHYYNRQDWGMTPRRLTQRNEPIKLRWLSNEVAGVFEHPEFLHRLNTKYQAQYDLQSQRFAKQLFQESAEDPARYMQAVLDWFQRNDFVYTLSPGRLGQHRIDGFLFHSRQGFCEHYASSFVMLMRYVGIPARVVTGYQGGQMAPDAASWEVRQLDAHAWSEVLIDGRWQRVDPTAMIAPNRIDAGMQNMLSQDDRVLGERTTLAKQRFHLVNKMRIWGDYASFQWQSKVIGYTAEAQRSWFNRLGLPSQYAAVFVLITAILAVIGFYFLVQYVLKSWTQSPIQRHILKLNRSLAPALQREPYETFRDWMQRLAQTRPEQEQHYFSQAADLFERYQYQNTEFSRREQRQLQDLLKTCASVFK